MKVPDSDICPIAAKTAVTDSDRRWPGALQAFRVLWGGCVVRVIIQILQRVDSEQEND